MVRLVKKRDGRIERFDLVKLAKWGQWAAEGIEDRVNWSSVMVRLANAKEKILDTREIHLRAISMLLSKKTWAANLMAGRLLAPMLYKETFGSEKPPTVLELHRTLQEKGLMRHLDYSEEEYAEIEKMIDHERDKDMVCFQLKQIYYKYGIQSQKKVKGKGKVKKQYETPQFVFMRMAMALAEDEAPEMRLHHLKKWYDHFSYGRINAPTPNYVNLGTPHRGLLSCCLYTTNDNAASLSIGAHIATEMTVQSAGIGGYIGCRSKGDDVRNGSITHQGKFPYYDLHSSGSLANTQGGRGGALTEYFICFDPEATELIMAQNPRTPVEKQRRKLHFGIMKNSFFVTKALRNEKVFSWNIYTAPDLHAAFFSGNDELFEELYNKYEKDESFEKNYFSARDLLLMAREQSIEVSTLYHFNSTQANRHTPFKDPIFSSNLCCEIYQPTKGYDNIMDLYKEENHGRGEVSMCGLGGIVITRIKDDEEYYDAAFYNLRMIGKCIHQSEYRLPHVGFMAKQRMNAAVGILGLAHHMAKNWLRYDTEDGLKEIHRVAERHYYFLAKASLALGKELGNAPLIGETKWVDGWTPLKTYEKNVDTLADFEYQYDWEALSKEIAENKGIYNSILVAHMPTESSSKASATTNGVYPVRALSLLKTDAKNSLDWCAPDGDILKDAYQIAYDIAPLDMIRVYGVIQKWTDGGISADLYRDRSSVIEINKSELLEEEAAIDFYGVKGEYYYNTLTPTVDESDIYGSDYLGSKDEEIDNDEDLIEESDIRDSGSMELGEENEDSGCVGCTL